MRQDGERQLMRDQRLDPERLVLGANQVARAFHVWGDWVELHTCYGTSAALRRALILMGERGADGPKAVTPPGEECVLECCTLWKDFPRRLIICGQIVGRQPRPLGAA